MLDNEEMKDAQILARFLLQLARLPASEGETFDSICNTFSNDLAAGQTTASMNIQVQGQELHRLTRMLVYDQTAFAECLEPILVALPKASVEITLLLEDPRWVGEMVLLYWLAEQKVEEESFVQPRPIGVGGFGIVSIAFKADTGRAYALKRSKIGRIDLKESDKTAAALEWKITSTIRSPFLIDSSFGYVNKDEIVLVLRAMSGVACPVSLTFPLPPQPGL